MSCKQEGFTPFPRRTKAVEPEVVGATDDTKETEVKSSTDSSSNGVQISDYEIFCIIGHFSSSYCFNAFLYILLTQLTAIEVNFLCILGSYLWMQLLQIRYQCFIFDRLMRLYWMCTFCVLLDCEDMRCWFCFLFFLFSFLDLQGWVT